MKLCSPDCPALCDFCIWYNFNGDHNGSFIDNGYCRLNGRVRWPEDLCEMFICGNWKSDTGYECSMEEYMNDDDDELPCPPTQMVRMKFRVTGRGSPRGGFEEEE